LHSAERHERWEEIVKKKGGDPRRDEKGGPKEGGFVFRKLRTSKKHPYASPRAGAKESRK